MWVGPVLVWLSLERLTDGSGNAGGAPGWGYWSLAALICGLFWEMWNAHSLSKWSYQIPYLDVLHVFEMPLAGYAGYLAFGLECAIAVAIVQEMKREG